MNMKNTIWSKSIIIIILLIQFLISSCSKDNIPDIKYDAEPIEYDLTIQSTENEVYQEALQQLLNKYLPNALSTKDHASLPADLLARFQRIEEKMLKISDSLQISGVKCLSVIFNSTGVDKKLLKVSGKIYLPNQVAPIKGIIVANHVLITDNASAPSQSIQIESLFAFMGYVVVMSDYIGFGATVDLPQTFLAQEITAKSSIDLTLTTYKYLKEKGYKFQYPDNRVNIIGYSQGGAVALACQKMIESYYPKEYKIKKTYAGGAPYDLEYTFRQLLDDKKSGLPLPYIALAITSLNYGENLNVDISKYFKGKLLQNYEEWLYSKRYNSTQLEKLIGTSDIREILSDSALDYSGDLIKPFIRALKKNSLIEWVPKAPIYLYHSIQDEYIPVYNTQEAYESFKKHSSASIELDLGNYGYHVAAAFDFYFKVFEKI